MTYYFLIVTSLLFEKIFLESFERITAKIISPSSRSARLSTYTQSHSGGVIFSVGSIGGIPPLLVLVLVDVPLPVLEVVLVEVVEPDPPPVLDVLLPEAPPPVLDVVVLVEVPLPLLVEVVLLEVVVLPPLLDVEVLPVLDVLDVLEVLPVLDVLVEDPPPISDVRGTSTMVPGGKTYTKGSS